MGAPCLSIDFSLTAPQIPPFLVSLGLNPTLNFPPTVQVNGCCHFKLPGFVFPISLGISIGAEFLVINALMQSAFELLDIGGFGLNCPF